ncbi:hypothetical protein GF374_01365 [Candidatus Woesearchaeota archaeon]|nr:hypothetical protein [Candidatus Woesearchaeota archaeon]
MREKHVAFYDENIKKAFEELKSGKSADFVIYKAINNAIDKLKQNPKYGIHIPKKLIPEEYIRKYDVDNLWKYNLPKAWRLLYTLKADKVMILAVILDWKDHKSYSRLFKYKK